MDDKQFYRFKESSEWNRGFEMEEQDWDDLSTRLDAAEARKPRLRPIAGWWWLAAAAVLLPLFLGNLYLYANFNQSQKDNHLLKQELEQLMVKHTHSKDTLVQTQYVYIRDTVQSTKIVYRDSWKPDQEGSVQPFGNLIREYSPVSLWSNGYQETVIPSGYRTTGPTWSGKTLTALLAERRILSESSRLEDSKDANLVISDYPLPTVEAPSNSNPAAKLSLGSLAFLPTLDYPILTSSRPHPHFWEDVWETNLKKEQRRDLLVWLKKHSQPRGFAISGGGAGLLPVVDESLETALGYMFETSAELIFAGSTRLWGAFGIGALNYNSHSMDASIGVPVIAAPGDDYVFQDAQVIREFLNYSLGLKHFWNTGGKWQPFVSLGYGITQTHPYTVIYDFQNQVSQDVDIKLETEVEEELLLYNILHSGLGVNYAWKDKWYASIGGYYSTQLERENLSIPNYLSIKAAVKYQF